MIFILASPASRPCDRGCGECDVWHVVIDLDDGGNVAQLCDHHLAAFLADWRREGLRAASERVPVKRAVKPE